MLTNYFAIMGKNVHFNITGKLACIGKLSLETVIDTNINTSRL